VADQSRVNHEDQAQHRGVIVLVATLNGVECPLTWKCRHMASAALRPRIESVRRDLGYEPPSICTPQEIMEI